jgi:hypothetical protein
MVDTPTPTPEAPAAPEPVAPTPAAPITDAATQSAPAADTVADTSGSDTVTGSDTTGGNDSVSGDDSAPGNDSVADSQAGNDSLSLSSYDTLTLGEDVVADEATLTEFKQIALDHNLPPEAAQSILALHTRMATAQAEAAHNLFTTTQADWQAQVQQLPEFKADKTAAEAAVARVLDEYGSETVRQILDVTGAGNHPEVVAMFLKLGKELGEGRPTPPGTPTNPKTPRTPGQILYGNSSN